MSVRARHASLLLPFVILACEAPQEPGTMKGGEIDPRSQQASPIQSGKPIGNVKGAISAGYVSIETFEYRPLMGTNSGMEYPIRKCSGIIFKKKWLLSAHHCWRSNNNPFRNYESPKIFGVKIFDAKGDEMQSLKSVHVRLNPDFDFAVAQLPEEYPFDTDIMLSLHDFESMKLSGAFGVVRQGFSSKDHMPDVASIVFENIDYSIEKEHFDNGFIGGETFETLFDQSKTCEGGSSLLGKSCMYTRSPRIRVSYDCVDKAKDCVKEETKGAAYPIVGDSGGACFDSRFWPKNKVLTSVLTDILKDTRLLESLPIGGYILNAGPMIGAVWPWMAEQKLLNMTELGKSSGSISLPFKPAAKSVSYHLGKAAGVSFLSVLFGDSIYFSKIVNTSFLPFWEQKVGPFSQYISKIVDFDYDSIDDLVGFYQNQFVLRRLYNNNQGNLSLLPEEKYQLPISSSSWEETGVAFIPVPTSNYLSIGRYESGSVQYIPWDAALGFAGKNLKQSKVSKCVNCIEGEFGYLNGDLIVDFVAFEEGKIISLIGDASGNFGLEKEHIINEDCFEGFRTLLDVNQDARPDYVCVDHYGVKVWLNSSENPSFASNPIFSKFRTFRDWPHQVRFNDINLDGVDDLWVPFVHNGHSSHIGSSVDIFTYNKLQREVYVMYRLGDGFGNFGEEIFRESAWKHPKISGEIKSS